MRRQLSYINILPVLYTIYMKSIFRLTLEITFQPSATRRLAETRFNTWFWAENQSFAARALASKKCGGMCTDSSSSRSSCSSVHVPTSRSHSHRRDPSSFGHSCERTPLGKHSCTLANGALLYSIRQCLRCLRALPSISGLSSIHFCESYSINFCESCSVNFCRSCSINFCGSC
jgi:hypothetical protein